MLLQLLLRQSFRISVLNFCTTTDSTRLWGMGEIDTKSIESVQAALSYFGEKNELRKPNKDTYQHKDLVELNKELANYKVQLEAKECDNLQALLNLQHYKKTVHELSTKLEECEAESKAQIHKLEIQMSDQKSEALKVMEQLQQATELITLRDQTVRDMEHRLLSNTLFIDSLQSELHQAREMSSCLEESMEDLNLKLEDEKRRAFKYEMYIESSNKQHDLLRIELKKAKEDTQLLNSQVENLTEELENAKIEFNKTENELQIEIAAKEDGTELRNEVEVMKKELEASLIRLNEFRTRAEQALSRAESAERAKVAVEGQLRKWREQKQKRKAAKAALKQETVQLQPIYDDIEQPVGKYQPLGKVLNMKF